MSSASSSFDINDATVEWDDDAAYSVFGKVSSVINSDESECDMLDDSNTDVNVDKRVSTKGVDVSSEVLDEIEFLVVVNCA